MAQSPTSASAATAMARASERHRARHQGSHGGGEEHRSQRAGWLRAAVLGANDGLLSTASVVLGVAAGNVDRAVLVLSGLAAAVAGAFSMAAGEFTSVSSQRDAELADLRAEEAELVAFPQEELRELSSIYERRGLSPRLARQVAEELHEQDALAAHARDELGFDPEGLASPLQAALVSFVSFALGALVPVITIVSLTRSIRSTVTAAVTLGALGALGALAARLGGAPRLRAAVRLVFLGGIAMAVTTLIGHLVGVSV